MSNNGPKKSPLVPVSTKRYPDSMLPPFPPSTSEQYPASLLPAFALATDEIEKVRVENRLREIEIEIRLLELEKERLLKYEERMKQRLR